jgi:hypothetical protein
MRQPLLPFALLMTMATPAFSDGVYKDRERIVERTVVMKPMSLRCPGGMVRLTNRSPDYAGSTMGLAKPSYFGTQRPDDGRASWSW